ncbi:Polysaccharide export protein, partial [mine drainage metagenome]
MRWTRFTIIFLALIASIAIGGCASDGGGLIASCAHGACGAVPYRIGPGDVLQVSVWKNPQLDRTEPVRPDGKISLPLLNDVRAAGLTPMQLRDKINARLTHFLTDPQVTVTVAAVHSLAVSVLGQVRHPGRYQFPAQPSVLEA